MRLVADTNELFSFFNEKSKSRELSLRPKLDLFSPAFALDELGEHKSEILERFSLSNLQFSLIRRLLTVTIRFVDSVEYSGFLSRAIELSPDPDDVDFFALALKLDCPIWSEDRKMGHGQSHVKVISTQELVELVQ